MPSLSTSPWILGAPQSGLARLISRINFLVSADSFGRPPSDFDFHRQYRRKPLRCQRTTVSGLTIAKALKTFGESEIYRRHVGAGDTGLTMQEVDEKVHEIITVA